MVRLEKGKQEGDSPDISSPFRVRWKKVLVSHAVMMTRYQSASDHGANKNPASPGS